MYKIEGYWDIKPKIKKVGFPVRGKMQVSFEDGRCLIVPISAFPSIKKVPVNQRNKWYIMGNGITWDTCPEVIHIEQLLGNYKKYAHETEM
jgi:hypothetical protein